MQMDLHIRLWININVNTHMWLRSHQSQTESPKWGSQSSAAGWRKWGTRKSLGGPTYTISRKRYHKGKRGGFMFIPVGRRNIYIYIYLFIYLFMYLFIYIYIYLSIYSFIYLFIYIHCSLHQHHQLPNYTTLQTFDPSKHVAPVCRFPPAPFCFHFEWQSWAQKLILSTLTARGRLSSDPLSHKVKDFEWFGGITFRSCTGCLRVSKVVELFPWCPVMSFADHLG